MLPAGFTSLEVDPWLVDGELLVAHDAASVTYAHSPCMNVCSSFGRLQCHAIVWLTTGQLHHSGSVFATGLEQL